MEQSRIQILKSLVDVILFIALFASFLVLYFVNETNDYLKASTTFASRTEEVDEYRLPVLIICLQPSYKPSIYGNDPPDLTYIFRKEELKNEERLADFLESANYKLNKDFQIDLIMLDDDNNKTAKHKLEYGQKVMDNFQIDVYHIQTMNLGVCYVIESGEIVNTQRQFEVFIKDLNSNNDDKLSNLNLFIGSPETWYGIIALSWPYFELERLRFSFDIQNTYHWMDMSVTNKSYLNGHKSVEECIENLMATNDVCKKCTPFFFSFKNKMTTCQSYEDYHCWFNWSFFITKNYMNFKKCMKPTKTTLYKAKPVSVGEKALNRSEITLLFTYQSDEIKIEEETLLMGTSSYIGSVGGSLGLFLGFSFFSSLSYFFGKLISIFMP